MKLLAVRAASFRRFGEGVAVEGLAPGVNLLAGPNEFGKSTLFQALEAAFLMKHTTSGAAIDSMRPRGGGEPLVEADFEIDGRRWRIRKQFGRGRGAILTDLEAGRAVARASEAEDQLASLTGARGDIPGRIGLMWVRQQRALQPPDLDTDPATGKARGRGEANALIDLLNAEVVEAAGSGIAEDIARRARDDLEALVSSKGARKGGLYDKALLARGEARAGLERAQAAALASEQRLDRIAKGTAMLAEAEDPAVTAALTQRIALLEKALSEGGAVRERNKALLDQMKARELEAKEARRAVADVRARGARARDLDQAVARGASLQATIAELSAALNANAATPARLNDLENALALARREELALEEMSTFVEVQPEAGAAGRILADGATLEGPARLSVAEHLTLEIAGIGVIRVTSSDVNRAASAKRRREEQQAAVARLLAEIGATGIEEARALAAARQAQSHDLEERRRALSEIAPRGIGVLAEERSALAPTLAVAIDALENAAAETDVQVLAARHALEEAKASGLDEARFEAMAEELADAKRDLQKRQADARRYSEHLERLKGEQAMADQDALPAGVEGAQDILQRAEADVRRCEDEIAALRLLCETLTGIIDNIRSRYLEPVSRALLPYLARVFPGSVADFRDGFTLQALRRAGEDEEFATLSDGTREQLAVLVRLGFARLFAERGACVPLVLDDPLVYSDDQRLAAMCGALNEAGGLHQVVVLTCRESAFSQLDAKKLMLCPWRDSST